MANFFNDHQVANAGIQNVTAINIGGFDATDQKPCFVVPPCAPGMKGVGILDIVLLADTATSGSDDTKKYNFQVKDKTNSVDLLATAITTYGNEIGADTAYHITPDQNNDNLGKDTVLEFDIAKTGSPTSLSAAEVTIYILWRFEVA